MGPESSATSRTPRLSSFHSPACLIAHQSNAAVTLGLLVASSEISSFSEKSDGVAEVPAASSVTTADDGVEGKGDADGKLSLRMKLVTPVEEVNSDRFSLQSEQRLAYLVLRRARAPGGAGVS